MVKNICVIRAMSIKLFDFHFGDKVNKKMAENQEKRRLFYPEQGPSPQKYVPLSFFGQITKSDTLVSLICSFQSDGLFHAESLNK